MDPWAWFIYIPGGVIVLAAVVIVAWLRRLQDRTEDHADRIAHLEGEHHNREAP